jgi:hypothetical protein
MEQAPVSQLDNGALRDKLDNLMKSSNVLFQNVNPFIPSIFEPRYQYLGIITTYFP